VKEIQIVKFFGLHLSSVNVEERIDEKEGGKGEYIRGL
jgi:hypothetical protein